jgi:precorrin-8X/cobalt-precorrin-8 methylmutase
VSRAVHPIEEESYAILRARADTSVLPPWTRAVTERVIHASADPGYLADLGGPGGGSGPAGTEAAGTEAAGTEAALSAGARALRAGAPVVADSRMTAAGITSRPVICLITDPRTAALAARESITRSAAGIRVAFTETGPGAVWVIGTAPTALTALLTLDAAPALVIGLPVGFVGAVEAKQALRDSGLPALTNRSEKGGAAVAAAAVNALLYAEPGQ